MHWSEVSLHKLTGQLNPLMAKFEASVPVMLSNTLLTKLPRLIKDSLYCRVYTALEQDCDYYYLKS
jgi:hypothetical protein